MSLMVVAMPVSMILLIAMMPMFLMGVIVIMLIVFMLDTMSMFILVFMAVNSTHPLILPPYSKPIN